MVSGALLFSVGGLALVRARTAPRILREHHDVAGFMLAIVGVIYAVLLAFVVLVVWKRYGTAEIVAEREANAVVDVYRLAAGFSPEFETTLRDNCKNYARIVVQTEWPLMEHGQSDKETARALDVIWANCTHKSRLSTSETVLMSQISDRLTDIGDNRRLRLLSSRSGISGPLWMVLIVSGAATIAFTFFFGLERFSIQVAMTSILALVIALVLFLISALNYPFTGDLAVHPEAMQTALERCQSMSD